MLRTVNTWNTAFCQGLEFHFLSMNADCTESEFKKPILSVQKAKMSSIISEIIIYEFIDIH